MMPLNNNDPSPLEIFTAAFAIAALAGIATLLKSALRLTPRAFLSAGLYSGLTGLITALIAHNHFREQNNVWFLLGVSALAGFGGATIIDTALGVLLRFIGKYGVDNGVPPGPAPGPGPATPPDKGNPS